MKLYLYLFIISFIILIPNVVNGQDIILSGSGLEVDKPELNVYIYLNGEAKNFGLTEKLVRSKIELPLRRNNIKIIDPNEIPKLYSLNVFINVLDNSNMKIFDLGINFNRLTTYFIKIGNDSVKNKRSKFVNTWEISNYGFSYDKDYIIRTLEDQLDIFINEFLDSNNFEWNYSI